MKDYSKLVKKTAGKLMPNPISGPGSIAAVQRALSKLSVYYDSIWQINDAIEKALLSAGLRLREYVDQAVPYGQTRHMILPTTDPNIYVSAQVYRTPTGRYELTVYSSRDRRRRGNPEGDAEDLHSQRAAENLLLDIIRDARSPSAIGREWSVSLPKGAKFVVKLVDVDWYRGQPYFYLSYWTDKQGVKTSPVFTEDGVTGSDYSELQSALHYAMHRGSLTKYKPRYSSAAVAVANPHIKLRERPGVIGDPVYDMYIGDKIVGYVRKRRKGRTPDAGYEWMAYDNQGFALSNGWPMPRLAALDAERSAWLKSANPGRRSRNPVQGLTLIPSPFSRYSELTSFNVEYKGRKIGTVHQDLTTGLWEAMDNSGNRHGNRYIRPNLAAEQLYLALGLGIGRHARNPESDEITEFKGEELTTAPEPAPEIKDDVESASQVYEEFHGRPSDEVLEVEEYHTERDSLAVLGQLVQLVVQSAANESIYKINFDHDVMLCCSADRKQLYVVGGEQSLDLASMGFAESAVSKDKVLVGPVLQVTYRTRKHFDDFDVIDYVHDMGEDGGMLPMLAYDRLNQTLEFVGGDYEIKPEGIVN